MDLIDRDGCRKLHEDVKAKYGVIDILVNDAGFGTCGKFTDTDLEKEFNINRSSGYLTSMGQCITGMQTSLNKMQELSDAGLIRLQM